MKARALVFTALALVILASPAAFAQRLPDFPGGGGPGYIPHPGIGGSVIARAYTSATLATSDGRVIGKAKTATVQTTSQLLQGLRVTVQELVAGSEAEGGGVDGAGSLVPGSDRTPRVEVVGRRGMDRSRL